MEKRKVMVGEGDVAIITCPFCRKVKKVSVLHYKETGQRQLKIRCSCDKLFFICLEYRKHHRKPTRILGKSINLSNRRENHGVIIKNVSLGGIGFCSFNKHRTMKDDRLQVLFNLNNEQHTPIDTYVTVRSATNDYIGCEFDATDKFKTSLGFYLIG